MASSPVEESFAPVMAKDTAPQPEDHVVSDLQVDFSDRDSSYGESDRSTISSSINSTVTQFRVEHGRRFHAFEENQYWLPNDDIEIGRLNIQHHCWRLSMGGKLFLAPLKPDIHHAVDIGTGTGEWAMEFAEQFPSTSVIGTDLSPVQDTKTPPNCSWLVDNAEQDWVYDTKFDYVHARMLLLGIHDWKRYFQQAWDNLKPGGWIEIQEPEFPIWYKDDGGVTDESPLKQWGNHIVEAAAKDGIDTTLTPKFGEYLKEQGFVSTHEQKVIWPIGAWSKGAREKALGFWTYENTKLFLDGSKLLFTKRLGWDIDRVDQFLKTVAEDMDNKKAHFYWRFFVFYAQKPEDV